jgi:hypothetical protein
VSPMRLDRIWPDIPRLLRARSLFRELGADTSSSVPAFLAWKAFMVTTRAEEGTSERARCERAVAECLRQYPEDVEPALRSFIHALGPFRNGINRVAVGEWYITGDEWDSLSAAEVKVRIDRVLARLQRLLQTERQLGAGGLYEMADDLTYHLYNVRNAVLAHAAVLSTGNLFPIVVPAFERAAEALALAGLSRRAGVAFRDAVTLLDA